MLNKISLVGNIGRDPEIRTSQGGAKIASFSVATSETWRDKVDGERKERVEWHNIVVFNPKLVDIIEKYYKKGQRVYVEGQIQSRKFTDSQGAERKTWEVVIRYKGESFILDNKGSGSISGDTSQGDFAPPPVSENALTDVSINDEIPF
jgi:single-strand DNA-binding protein